MISGPRFAQTQFEPYWPSTVPQTEYPPLEGDIDCDLAVIGAGFTGLWSALKAHTANPEARIVVLDAAHPGHAASTRNGGFCAPSISHGVSNALARWSGEAETLIRLGRQNLDAMQADLEDLDAADAFERPGKLNLAATPWQAEGLKEMQAAYARFGIRTDYLEGPALQELLASPAYVAGLFEPNYALVNPAKVVHALCTALADRAVPIHAGTTVRNITDTGTGLTLTTSGGRIRAGQAILATNAAVPLIAPLRRSIIPIFDYTILTEPLSEAQLREIGWQGAHGIADSGNRFHYSRKTADRRILWGGYDAIYHRGSRRDPALLHRAESYATLEANFLAAFPSLSGVRFSHAWGGIIDTSARLTFFAGTALGGRLAYALGFTGQGVSASRFAALTMLDLLAERQTERTRLAMIRKRPFPFPPEPLRSLAVGWAQRDLAREDETGRRSLFLRILDRMGIGFGS